MKRLKKPGSYFNIIVILCYGWLEMESREGEERGWGGDVSKVRKV